jgi:N-acetylglucosamine-6-phosphate deacetylase
MRRVCGGYAVRYETLLIGAWVVTPDGVLDPGWVAVDGGRIAAVGSGAPPAPAAAGRGAGLPHPARVDLGGSWLLPGFVDLHRHGCGGHDVTASPGEMAAAVVIGRGSGTVGPRADPHSP